MPFFEDVVTLLVTLVAMDWWAFSVGLLNDKATKYMMLICDWHTDGSCWSTWRSSDIHLQWFVLSMINTYFISDMRHSSSSCPSSLILERSRTATETVPTLTNKRPCHFSHFYLPTTYHTSCWVGSPYRWPRETSCWVIYIYMEQKNVCQLKTIIFWF